MKFIALILLILVSAVHAGEKTFEIKNELKAATFLEGNGDDALKVIEGKLFGLYFTAKWCSPCQTFTPELVKFRNNNIEKFQFITVSWDRDLKSQEAYMKKTKMDVPSIRFDDPLVKMLSGKLQVQGIPTLVVFNRKGEIITYDARDLINILQTEEQMKELARKEGGAELAEMVAPYQEKLKAKRNSEIAYIREACKGFENFPYFEEMIKLHGYAKTSGDYKKILTQLGQEIASDWDNKNDLLNRLLELSQKFKPNSKGYRGSLEVYSGSVFEALGQNTSNPKIREYLLESVKSANSSLKQWSVSGIISGAVKGNEDFQEILLNYEKNFPGVHMPLTIFPVMKKYCWKHNESAIELAYKIYDVKHYYAYSAFPLFYVPALEGNKKAIDAVAAIALHENINGYEKHALSVLQDAAKKHEYARQKLTEVETALKG